jgi:hypothetical protein
MTARPRASAAPSVRSSMRYVVYPFPVVLLRTSRQSTDYPCSLLRNACLARLTTYFFARRRWRLRYSLPFRERTSPLLRSCSPKRHQRCARPREAGTPSASWGEASSAHCSKNLFFLESTQQRACVGLTLTKRARTPNSACTRTNLAVVQNPEKISDPCYLH